MGNILPISRALNYKTTPCAKPDEYTLPAEADRRLSVIMARFLLSNQEAYKSNIEHQ
jgi:hypothetical protein